MSYFKAKMHQIQFRLGLCPRPHWESLLSTPPEPLAGFKGPTSEWKEGRGREGKERGKRRASGGGGGRHSLARPLRYSTRCQCCSIRPNWALIIIIIIIINRFA